MVGSASRRAASGGQRGWRPLLGLLPLLALLIPVASRAVSPGDLPARIRTAIVELADRIATVNLDERG